MPATLMLVADSMSFLVQAVPVTCFWFFGAAAGAVFHVVVGRVGRCAVVACRARENGEAAGDDEDPPDRTHVLNVGKNGSPARPAAAELWITSVSPAS